ncbi:hypothetical protein DR950_00025 [Kitasatospora xanthocidica]|uniref:Uncharacterized protein n=1 Tax=Kitasatospora xanthocidica TaxID=83382 RepID=A0A372ZMB6_9ACTN|nr:hypothetical protein [Kitasatospora xanthocidica]RGD56387.1 hypothetical protein DR950_00025 [Kitasatospora xanthocidica]
MAAQHLWNTGGGPGDQVAEDLPGIGDPQGRGRGQVHAEGGGLAGGDEQCSFLTAGQLRDGAVLLGVLDELGQQRAGVVDAD